MRDDRFDTFIQGDDGLARLLRAALPCFEAPAEMNARFAANMAQLQASHNATQSLVFEAPPQQTAAFASLAAAMQETQAPRRDAVLARLQTGASETEVLGHPISPEASAWLAQQTPPTPSATQTEKPQKSWFLRHWAMGGLSFAVVALLAFGLHLQMGINPAPKVFNEQAAASATVTQLAQLEMTTPAESATAPEAKSIEIAPIADNERKFKAAPEVDIPAKKSRAITEERLSLEKELAKTESAKGQRFSGELALNDAQPAALEAPVMAAAPPPPMVTMAPAPAPAMEIAAADKTAERAYSSPKPAALASGLMTSKRARSQPPETYTFALSTPPAVVAKQLQSQAAQAAKLTIRVQNPEATATQEWLTQFRAAWQSNPANPALRLSVETDSSLSNEQLRVIIQP